MKVLTFAMCSSVRLLLFNERSRLFAKMHVATHTAGERPVTSSLNPERWVEDHCDELYRYALTRVSQPEIAKDLVQETFLAAWRSAENYSGKATERTWLFSIMRNKIVDHYRSQKPEFGVDDLSELAEFELKQFQQSGAHKGKWNSSVSPGSWSDSAHHLENAEFWDVVQECTGKLPPKAAAVFSMRELDGESCDAICTTLEINPNHLGVLLHRARLALRRCLEIHWFKTPTSP